MKLLQVNNISVSYDNKDVIKDININLDYGEIISLLGPSGVGKSTLFNVIAGVLKPDSGNVLLNGNDIVLKPGNISYMLQKDLLLEQKTVMDNVILPLIINNIPKKDAIKKANEYMDIFGLKGYENKYPLSLSGGMRQRAAFLRTYLAKKEVLLLDEPFSALDSITKSAMHKWYDKIRKELNLSTIFITHDVDEALILSDRVYVMNGVPGGIKKQIVIEKKEEDFLLTNAFLEYKKEILNMLKS